MSNINSKFYCIQPIQIGVDSLSKLFGLKVDINKINKSAIKDTNYHPKWKKMMDDLYNLYSSLVVLDMGNIFDSNILKKELEDNNFLLNEKLNISKYINNDNSNVYLMFDYRLLQFIVVYEIEFILQMESINSIIEFENDKLDFYNCIRNIYVQEEDDSIVLPHIKQLKSNIINYLQNYLKTNFSLNLTLDDIKIPNNSGNITNVISMDNVSKENYSKLAKKLIELNSFAERIPNNNIPIELDGNHKNNELREINYQKELYYFNGRFHTIILHTKKNEYRYLPIQFQMQFLWFYLSKQINLVLEKYNDNILNDDSISKVIEYSDQIDLIINKVEILNIFNQKFKLAIESDSKIYYLVEHRWNIEDMIKGSNEYIKFFKDYLSRLYTKKTSKMEQRQNKILLFLTLFQFIALLSVWNDYLSLLDDDIKNKADEIIPIFGNYQMLETINLYSPIGFFIAIIFMLFYIYRNKN